MHLNTYARFLIIVATIVVASAPAASASADTITFRSVCIFQRGDAFNNFNIKKADGRIHSIGGTVDGCNAAHTVEVPRMPYGAAISRTKLVDSTGEGQVIVYDLLALINS